MAIRIGSQTRAATAIAPRAIVVAVVALSVGLLAAGCGAGGAPSGPGPSAATFTAAAFKYARCMRGDGVTGFPDPSMTDHNGQQVAYLATSSSLAASPAFKHANKVCQRILTPTLDTTQSLAAKAARADHLAAFASCMRGRGVSAFPDPNAQGQLSAQMIAAAGVDLQAPAVFAAAKRCLASADGAITGQEIERAVSGTQ
jgi:hypothetical protein